jgi:hypothetical protein
VVNSSKQQQPLRDEEDLRPKLLTCILPTT